MSLAGGWDASPVTPQPPGPPYLKTHLDAVYKNNIFLVIFLDVLPPTKEKNKINAYVHINTKKIRYNLDKNILVTTKEHVILSYL